MAAKRVLLISSPTCGWGDLRAALRGLDEVTVVGDTTDAREGLRLVEAMQPEVLICSDRIGACSAAAVLRRLRSVCPAALLLIIGGRIDWEILTELDALDLTGYLLWDNLHVDTLRTALSAGITGELAVGSRTVSRAVIDLLRGRAPRDVPTLDPPQLAVLRRLAQDHTDKEIAALERMPLRTVERTVGRLKEVLGVRTRMALGVRAGQLGLVRAEDLADDGHGDDDNPPR